MSLSVLYCGSPEFAAVNLKALLSLPFIFKLSVVSQPDKIRARGKKIIPTEVKQFALNNNLDVFCPATKQEFSNIVETINPDIIVVVAYAMIIPKHITDNFLCVNAHASLLPDYRGASPIQSAILNQDSKTGICLIHMNENLDEGPVISRDELQLTPQDTFDCVHNKLAKLSATSLCNFLVNYNKTKQVDAKEQNHSLASYCHKIQKEDLLLDLTKSPKAILAQIKAYSSKPGAYIIHNDKRIKIIDAAFNDTKLSPTKIQLEGKPIISYSDYLLGRKDPISLC
jgi:methionyl-tRNA formyltransferase